MLVYKAGIKDHEVSNLLTSSNASWDLDALSKAMKDRMVEGFGSRRRDDKDKNHKIKMPENSGRGLKLAINNFIQFLSLLSISALLIASVGLANSLLSYLNDKYISIAIKKAIGMKNSKIKLIYYCELFFLLIIFEIILS